MKGRSIVEVPAVFSLLQLIILLWGASGLMRWGRRVLGWSYFTGFLTVLVPTLALVLGKRELEPSGLALGGRPAWTPGLRGASTWRASAVAYAAVVP